MFLKLLRINQWLCLLLFNHLDWLTLFLLFLRLDLLLLDDRLRFNLFFFLYRLFLFRDNDGRRLLFGYDDLSLVLTENVNLVPGASILLGFSSLLIEKPVVIRLGILQGLLLEKFLLGHDDRLAFFCPSFFSHYSTIIY